jgi:hypothetical protein
MHRLLHFLPIAVLLLVLAVPTGSIVAKEAAAYDLYATTEQGGGFIPIDPLSLAPLAGKPPFAAGVDYPQVAVSTDGSTVVSIDPSQGPLDARITVRDGVLGNVRTRITTQNAVYNPRLSADGSRLVVEPTVTCGPSGCDARTLYTYDTRSGTLVSKAVVDLGDPVWPDMFHPSGHRIYMPFYERLEPPDGGPATPAAAPAAVPGPWPLQIAVFDLDSGEEVDRVTVPDVMAGSWQLSATVQAYVGAHELPAIALSPDGSRIAVVDARSDRLTVLETATMEPVATLAIHEREGLASRLLGWLGLMPQPVSAKVSEGTQLAATFAADGQSLYLTGSTITVGETYEQIEGEGRGLTRIDLESGEIIARSLEGYEMQAIIAAPDGRSVYAVLTNPPWWEGSQAPRYVLARHDAVTLEPLTKRAFDNWIQVLLVSSS